MSKTDQLLMIKTSCRLKKYVIPCLTRDLPKKDMSYEGIAGQARMTSNFKRLFNRKNDFFSPN